MPISYLDQRGGRLLHDIFPTVANATKVSSQSSSVGLGFHSEMFFHPTPPDFLMLHCLRADPDGEAATSIASTKDIIQSLPTKQAQALSREEFALDLARLHGSYQHNGRGIVDTDERPVVAALPAHHSGRPVRFEPELTTATTKSGRARASRSRGGGDKRRSQWPTRCR